MRNTDGVFLYNIGDACFDLPTPANYHHHAKERALRIENVKLVRCFVFVSFVDGRLLRLSDAHNAFETQAFDAFRSVGIQTEWFAPSE